MNAWNVELISVNFFVPHYAGIYDMIFEIILNKDWNMP